MNIFKIWAIFHLFSVAIAWKPLEGLDPKIGKIFKYREDKSIFNDGRVNCFFSNEDERPKYLLCEVPFSSDQVASKQPESPFPPFPIRNFRLQESSYDTDKNKGFYLYAVDQELLTFPQQFKQDHNLDCNTLFINLLITVKAFRSEKEGKWPSLTDLNLLLNPTTKEFSFASSIYEGIWKEDIPKIDDPLKSSSDSINKLIETGDEGKKEPEASTKEENKDNPSVSFWCTAQTIYSHMISSFKVDENNASEEVKQWVKSSNERSENILAMLGGGHLKHSLDYVIAKFENEAQGYKEVLAKNGGQAALNSKSDKENDKQAGGHSDVNESWWASKWGLITCGGIAFLVVVCAALFFVFRSKWEENPAEKDAEKEMVSMD